MRGRRALDDHEVNAMLEVLSGLRNKALFVTCLYLGSRLSETLKLNVADVVAPGEAVEGGGIRLRRQITLRKATTKGKVKSRVIDVHPSLRAWLLRYLEERGVEPGPLFRAGRSGPTKADDRRLSRRQATRIFQESFRSQDVERGGSHSMRKTFAQRLIDSGKSLGAVQELLGHSDIRHTREYFEVNPTVLADAVDSLPPLPAPPP